MKVSKGIRRLAIIFAILSIIIYFLFFISPIQPNLLYFLGESTSLFCGTNGYKGSVWDSKSIDCCGKSRCNGPVGGPCTWNGVYICE